MKTQTFFAVGLLLSTAAFSQDITAKTKQSAQAVATQSVNQSGAATSATAASSTSATVKTHAITKAEDKAGRTKQEAKEKLAAEKDAASAKAQRDAEMTKKEAQKNREVSAGIDENSQVKAENGDNKVNGNSSLHSKATVSSAKVKSDLKAVHGEIRNNTNATGNAAVKTIAGVQQAVKPRPAAIKIGTQVRSNAGLRIK